MSYRNQLHSLQWNRSKLSRLVAKGLRNMNQCQYIVRFSLLLCSVILYLSSISDNLNSVSVVENTIWEQWSSCTQTCFSHSSVMPKRTRSGKSKNGVDIRQDGVCEGEMQVCPFGKLSFLGPVTCSF